MLMYKRSNHLEVIRYSDSDFIECIDSRKSTFGYLFLLGERAVSWKTTIESIVASFTMEENFVACFEATIYALWLWNFISRLKVVDTIIKPLKIYCDNFATVFFFKNDKYLRGFKHMELKYFDIKEEV